MFQMISMRQLEGILDRGGNFTLLDVREREEYENGHLRGAVSIPLDELEARAREIPRDRPVIIYCAYGSHSMMAARLLDRMGYRAVNTVGGLASYRGKYFSETI